MLEELVRAHLLRKLPRQLSLRRHQLLNSEYSTATEQRLQQAVVAFLDGLRSSIQESSMERLNQCLAAHDRWSRGFAYEGAAMGISLKDGALFWKAKRLPDFLARWGRNYIYVVHVGIGWAMAKRNISPDRFRHKLDPLLGWLAVDGFGFYLGLFHAYEGREYTELNRYSGYTSRVLFQGYGRALWFLTRGSVNTIAEAIRLAPPDKREDLWSGVGLACVYAGTLENHGLSELVSAADRFYPALAQGATFAAKARKLAGDLTRSDASDRCAEAGYLDLACQKLCGVDAATAATITDDALDDLPPEGETPSFEIWRRRVQEAFSMRSGIICRGSSALTL
jgi:enediyne biosynthesis protein E3